MSKPSLLLVDKDPKSRRVLEVSLRKAGYEVQLASGSAEAQEFLSQKNFDAVISDLSQEGPEAIALLSRLKSSNTSAAIPFVFLTREGQVEEKKRALEAGAAELIDRPIYAKEFLARVKILLQKQTRARMEGTSEQGTFSGSLSDLGVVDLLQTIERGHKTGVVSIESDNRRGEIFFRNGRVIDASLGRLVGEDAVYRMFLWSDGAYSGEFKNVRQEERIKLSSQGLVLEGMRRLEEWTRLLDGLPPVQHICEVDYPALAERLGELPDEVNAILRLFDGHRSLLQVIDDADFGPLETLTILGKLYAEGILYDTVQKPTKVKGSIPSLELERWLSGLPPVLEAAKEANALPSEIEPRDGGIVEVSEAPAVQPEPVKEEPGLSLKSPAKLAPEPAPIEATKNGTGVLAELSAQPSKEPEKPAVAEPVAVQPETKKPAPVVEAPAKPEPVKVEAKASKPEPEKAKPEPEKVKPEKTEPKAEEKKPAKPAEPEEPKPRALAAQPQHEDKDDDDGDDLLPASKSNNTLYYVLAAALVVVVGLFAFGGGSKDKNKGKNTPAPKSVPVEIPNPKTEPVSTSVPASSVSASSTSTSMSLPTSDSMPASASAPVLPVELTPEQKKQYTTIVDKGGALYTAEKYDEALAQFREALKIDPNGSDALYGVGNTLYDKGYYAFSDEDPKKTKEQKTAAAIPLFDESIKTLTFAVEKHPENARLQFTLAAVSEYRSKEENKALSSTLVEDRQRAKAAYEAYLKLEPKGDYAQDAKDGVSALKKLLATP